MKNSLIALLQCSLIDLGERCGISTSRDFKTVTVRVEHEGLSFLTISLANFGKDFQKSLDQGFVGSNQFAGFQRTGGLPRFLGGFLRQVFTLSGDRLLDVPSIAAIQAIRQITLMWAKIDLQCSPERMQAAFDKYLEIEQDIRHYDYTLSNDVTKSPVLQDRTLADRFQRVGRLLWAELFTLCDEDIAKGRVVPKHGGGATADRRSGNGKYDPTLWTTRLENVFPFWEHLFPNQGTSCVPRYEDVIFRSPGTEIPVKVIMVPKTLKTPRIIAMEPTEMQYMQQGILRVMNRRIREVDISRNLICSDSQLPNQVAAKKGSMDGTLATLDLSEASDRVSNQHVRLLLANHRFLREAVDATRSRKADVQGRTIRLAKFASMGSALCFPMEALVFMTVVFVGIEEKLNRRLTIKDVQSLYGSVRVYGDDIIVPVDYVQSVLQALETFGFRVSIDKSFWTGKFRESCGKDYYDGHDVSIVKVRSRLAENRRDTRELERTVSLRNHMFHGGFVPPLHGWTHALKGLFLSL